MFFPSSKRPEKKSSSRLSTSTKDRQSPKSERTRDRDRERKEEEQNRERDRTGERDRERDSGKPSDRRPKVVRTRTSSSRVTSSSSSTPRDTGRSSKREKAYRTVSHSSSSSSKMAPVVPEMQRRASIDVAAAANPSSYPSFSKAHSKESVGSREDAINPRISLYTPNTTDLGKGGVTRPATTGAAPPSPPLTATTDMRRAASANSMRKPNKAGSQSPAGRRSTDAGPRHSISGSRLRPSTSRESPLSSTTRSSKPSTVRESTTMTGTRATSDVTERTEETTDSDATSVAPSRPVSSKPRPTIVDTDSSPASAMDSSPRTPVAHELHYPSSTPVESKGTPMVEVLASGGSTPFSPNSMPANTPGPPPPPPPMPQMPQHPPRVDYLLQYGGLPHVVPRSLLAGVSPIATLVGQQANGVNKPPASSPSIASIFAPLNNVLDSYNQVMSKDGSIAVATGYRSVARRLLDRLEAVFARNISSETCPCIMCKSGPRSPVSPVDETGVSWGEILEYVAGRRELPAWPPFSISSTTNGLGISGAEPMQKLDIDVPEEYRDHYFRQSKKTKTAVQSWLAAQPDFPSSPPQEADDETLTFAILTHLDPEKRPVYHALLRGLSTLPTSRAPTPLNAAKGEMIPKTALALQRLYRLDRAPRDAECTIFLLNNPQIHAILATVAAVSPHEWEILVSGRFDGFLWSGAESTGPTPLSTPSPLLTRNNPSRGLPSRTTTPATGSIRGPTPYYGNQPRWPTPNGAASRGPTPGGQSTTSNAQSQSGAPVQLDEDTELAALAEVEREIYLGMEALEDAFEALHNKAEIVRTSLRTRSAGLAAAAQARRGSAAGGIEVRMGTPASQASVFEGYDGAESVIDFMNDAASELAPDDSASNVGFRDRRRHRDGRESRKQRRTPAPVEEEGEDDDSATDVTPRDKHGRRRK